jgi:hypothetical protein
MSIVKSMLAVLTVYLMSAMGQSFADVLHAKVYAHAPAKAGEDVDTFNDGDEVVAGTDANNGYSEPACTSWIQATAAAQWGARDGHTSVVYDGKIWVIGGWVGGAGGPQHDVWSSSDGVTWTQAAAAAA